MKVFSVSELTQEVKKQLETGIGTVYVRGEVINLKVQSSGHLYFTLKDAEAQISAVLFRGVASSLTRLPKEGNQITVRGELTVYPPRGGYQILVRALQFQGEGELLAKLQERKRQMQALGYFDPTRKKKLPPFPKTIGVVTSPTGAVIQDIIQILKRRFSGFHLILSPVKVQGPGAKEEIAKAIDQFNQYKLADVLIVGRGGGSLEDLWAFNEEEVVQAILRSEIPIISSVGHETDFCLSDFVADLRAPTPSAAAELVIQEKEQHINFLLQCQKQIHHRSTSLLLRLKNQLQTSARHPYLSSPYLLLSKRMQQLDDIKQHLTSSATTLLKQKKLELLSLEKQKNLLNPAQQIPLWKNKFTSIQKTLDQSFFHRILEKKKDALHKVAEHLCSINPKNLLSKGYCILFSENKDSVILSAKELSVSDKLQILIKDGQVKVKVEEIQ